MDAYEIAAKIQKYWMTLVPKHSGEMSKSSNKIKVVVNTNDGYKEVTGVHFKDDFIIIEINKE